MKDDNRSFIPLYYSEDSHDTLPFMPLLVAPLDRFQDTLIMGPKNLSKIHDEFINVLFHNIPKVDQYRYAIKAFSFQSQLYIALLLPTDLKDEAGRRGLMVSIGFLVEKRFIGNCSMLPSNYLKALLRILNDSLSLSLPGSGADQLIKIIQQAYLQRDKQVQPGEQEEVLREDQVPNPQEQENQHEKVQLSQAAQARRVQMQSIQQSQNKVERIKLRAIIESMLLASRAVQYGLAITRRSNSHLLSALLAMIDRTGNKKAQQLPSAIVWGPSVEFDNAMYVFFSELDKGLRKPEENSVTPPFQGSKSSCIGITCVMPFADVVASTDIAKKIIYMNDSYWRYY